MIPVSHLLLAVRIGEREHGVSVFHLCEVLVQVASHSLCRRVRVIEFGMLLFQILQFMHQHVKLHVAHERLVQHIISVVLLVQQLSELFYTFCIVVHMNR